jgi:hypothetical protein
MRRSLRATVAFAVSLAVVLIAVAASASNDTPTAPPPAGPGQGGHAALECKPTIDGCTGRPGLGGSAPGSPGMGTAPGSAGSGIAGSDPGSAGGPCGTTVVNGAGPDGTVSYTPCGSEPPTPIVPTPNVVEPQPGMVGLHAIPFDTARVGSDGRTITIDFVSGVAPCSVLDHIDVRYGGSTVTITLFEGSNPSAGQVACIEIAQYERVVIMLDQLLGDRAIVDGAPPRSAEAA